MDLGSWRNGSGDRGSTMFPLEQVRPCEPTGNARIGRERSWQWFRRLGSTSSNTSVTVQMAGQAPGRFIVLLFMQITETAEWMSACSEKGSDTSLSSSFPLAPVLALLWVWLWWSVGSGVVGCRCLCLRLCVCAFVFAFVVFALISNISHHGCFSISL